MAKYKVDPFYKVTFVTKKGGYKNWFCYTQSSNAAEAEAWAKEHWYLDSDAPHMFQVKAKRMPHTRESMNMQSLWFCQVDENGNIVLSTREEYEKRIEDLYYDIWWADFDNDADEFY